MSSAVAERNVEQPVKFDLILVNPAPRISERETLAEKPQWDPYPLFPVFVAIAISLMLAGMFIGAILVWLSVRHSGVMSP
jgi:hypothetical protein